ncbi:MAG: hypothetical protein Q8N10_03525 [Phenylobacterium sp.]|uniref:hypothetical protein n=1 Tax=Phenylobacterium sp. TaxID=1871053 RepID=UPI002728B955|nr:hypothetical protein [Phenylobacterium sp.]MDO8912341.1 hypothetical protein [Phenylobacterium sp.]MDP3099553.1 hypothetical protein [Phenylobacterium sp.]
MKLPQAKYTRFPWYLERIESYQGEPHLVGAQICCASYLIGEISGAIEIGGRPHSIHLANTHLMIGAASLDRAAREIDRLALIIDSAVRHSEPGFRDTVLGALKANRAAILKAAGQ